MDIPIMNTQTPEDAFAAAYKNASGPSVPYSWLGKIGGWDASERNRQELLNSYYTNAYNSAEAAKNRDWQEYMSNTANQRAAADLKAIGFSPFALLGGASSATTPSGFAASASNSPSAHKSDSGNAIGFLIKALATVAVASAGANSAAAATKGVTGNSAASVAKSAAEGAAKGATKNAAITLGKDAEGKAILKQLASATKNKAKLKVAW